jgi:hypothetical protein
VEKLIVKFMFAGWVCLLVCGGRLMAQTVPPDFRTGAGCGPEKTQFNVSEGPADKTVGTPSPGKALVYVIARPLGSEITSRVGVDGTWVGANHGGGYISFEVDPGDRHVCIDWQSSVKVRQMMGAAALLTAEPGKVYYFLSVVIEDATLVQVDEAEGMWLLSLSQSSKWAEKK